MTVIVFQVKEYRCALRAEEVEELLPMAKLSKTPGMPSSMEGMLNIGGKIVPVFRMDRLFGVAEIALTLYTPIILVKTTQGTMGFIIEKALGVYAVAEKDVAPLRSQAGKTDLMEAEVTIKDERASLISIRKLLLREELENAKGFGDLIERKKKEAELLKTIAA